jgi:hypothetical protein
MTLTDFVKQPHVRTRLAECQPKLSRKIDGPLHVPSKSYRYGLIGTAFDYLLRFEIGRRDKNVVESPWIACHVASGQSILRIASMKDDVRAYCESHADFDVDELRDQSENLPLTKRKGATAHIEITDPYEVYFYRAVRKVIEEAQADIKEYRANCRPSRGEMKQAAFHAIRLAKIDVIARCPKPTLDPTFEQAERYDIDELVELLDIVPWADILRDVPIMLNPVLGSSELVIGADADLIVGGCLIDIKTTEEKYMRAEWFNQLLCYFMLARFHQRTGELLPVIDSVGFYFSRHATLWRQDARIWTDLPTFLDLESWFLREIATNRPN